MPAGWPEVQIEGYVEEPFVKKRAFGIGLGCCMLLACFWGYAAKRAQASELVPKAGFGGCLEVSAGTGTGQSIVEVPDSEVPDLTTSFTVEFWFKGSTAEQKYLLGRNGINGSDQWAVVAGPNNGYILLYPR